MTIKDFENEKDPFSGPKTMAMQSGSETAQDVILRIAECLTDPEKYRKRKEELKDSRYSYERRFNNHDYNQEIVYDILETIYREICENLRTDDMSTENLMKSMSSHIFGTGAIRVQILYNKLVLFNKSLFGYASELSASEQSGHALQILTKDWTNLYLAFKIAIEDVNFSYYIASGKVDKHTKINLYISNAETIKEEVSAKIEKVRTIYREAGRA